MIPLIVCLSLADPGVFFPVSSVQFSGPRSLYSIEAAISTQYCLAPRFEETDWRAIAGLYDALLKVKRSPLVKLNRAVVLARIQGPKAAIDEIHRIEGWESLAARHYLYSAVLGQLYLEANDVEKAKHFIAAAGGLTSSEAEKKLLNKKLSSLSWYSHGVQRNADGKGEDSSLRSPQC